MRLRHCTIAATALFVITSVSAVLYAGQAGTATTRSVWDGAFTNVQAARGETQFNAHCAECHGGALGGGEGPALVGDRFWNSWRESTVDALLGHVSRNMPFSEDGSLAGTLSALTYADMVAYILSRNEFPTGSQELTAESSVGVQIIRRDGPGELPSSTLAHVVGCLVRGGDGGWVLAKATKPVRAASAVRGQDGEVPLGTGEIALKFVLTRLDRYDGYRMAATGALIGDGGVDGINVDTVTPVAARCE